MAEPLKRTRRHRGLSLRALAASSGVNRDTIWRIETGAQRPHAATAKKIADALGVSVADVRELANGDDPSPAS